MSIYHSISIEKFETDEELRDRMQKKLKKFYRTINKYMCKGIYFSIKLPLIGRLMFCIPAFSIPIPISLSFGAGGRNNKDCDGTDVCEI